MSLFALFYTFLYIGFFTIGGGIVSLTLMQQTIVAKGIISEEMFYNMVAISESTPGPLGTNMATYIGYSQHGVIGGIVATLAEVLPSIIVIVIVAHFIQKFNSNPLLKGALDFLRPVTTGLILVPAVNMFVFSCLNLPSNLEALKYIYTWKSLFEWINLAAYGVFVFLLFKFKPHPIIVILLGAVFGIIFC